MSALNLNKVVLCGRLTADPELKQTPSGVAVCSFTLAINRRFQSKNADGTPTAAQQADFISVVAWRDRAEFISRYFRKGSALCITGSIQTRSWQDQNGQKRYATEVIVDEAMFVDGKNDAQGAFAATADQTPAPAYNAPQAPNFEPLSQDDDLPF
jgi:single-strand DNA-binding protein